MSIESTKNCLHQYASQTKYSKQVVYLSMEFALDQALKIYSGGLGYLAGSHMRSAYELNQNMIGVGILWKYGYYDQTRDANNNMQISFIKKDYSFLVDTGIQFEVSVAHHPVWVKVWLLPPDVFQSVPLFLLSTDVPENDDLSKTITERLYAPNDLTRIAESIVLGVGAHKLMQVLDIEPEIWHMNEAHSLPLIYSLYQNQYRNWDTIKGKTVFTTHTPEQAGNEKRPLQQLVEMDFFCGLSGEIVQEASCIDQGIFSYTETAILRTSKQNAVSKLHETVCKDSLYPHLKNYMHLGSVTNAQNCKYWQDAPLHAAIESDNDSEVLLRKKELKKELFKIVADQTGKLFDPNILTIVWARRFAGYKRAWFLMKDQARFWELTSRDKEPIQVIWAGKPYPFATADIDLFHWLGSINAHNKRVAVLTGYELSLSALLKKGSDVWLNTPRYLHEASGTSGMTAAMNGSINLSIDDGWVAEFAKHAENAFVIPHADISLSEEVRDELEYQKMMHTLEREVIPMYYHNHSEWVKMLKTSAKSVVKNFDSSRMAKEYYEKMYH